MFSLMFFIVGGVLWEELLVLSFKLVITSGQVDFCLLVKQMYKHDFIKGQYHLPFLLHDLSRKLIIKKKNNLSRLDFIESVHENSWKVQQLSCPLALA